MLLYISDKNGFTIVEVIVVLGILGILLLSTAPVAWEFYQGIDLKSEYQNHLSYLKLARAYAMANKNASAHGVRIGEGGATIFQGSSFAGRDQNKDQFFPRSFFVSTSGSSEIIFGALSGTSTSVTITISNTRGSYNITINTHGKIE
jgi:prepilin-type N-terminal cleavage/methylation domain-containing protein